MSVVPLHREGRAEEEQLLKGERERRFVHVPKQPPKRRTVTFRLTTRDHERLEELRHRTGAGTISEVLLRALSTYDLLVDYLEDGYVLSLEHPDDARAEQEEEELERKLAYLLGSSHSPGLS